RTAAPRAACAAERTQHSWALLYNRGRNRQSSSERTLQSPGWGCRARSCCMSDAVFRHESAVEYFKELVDGALSHQGLATQELTAFYVVQLLTSFLQRPILGEH